MTVAPPRPIRLRSARTTAAPVRAASRAAYMPAPPAPITRTSVSICIGAAPAPLFRDGVMLVPHSRRSFVMPVTRGAGHAALRGHRQNIKRDRLERGFSLKFGLLPEDVSPGGPVVNSNSVRLQF